MLALPSSQYNKAGRWRSKENFKEEALSNVAKLPEENLEVKIDNRNLLQIVYGLDALPVLRLHLVRVALQAKSFPQGCFPKPLPAGQLWEQLNSCT